MKVTVRAVMTLSVFLFILAQPAAAQVPGSPCIAEPTDMFITFGDVITCGIDPAGDLDLFRFHGTAGQRVRLQLAGESFPCWEIVSPLGTRLTLSCSGGLPLSHSVVLPETGTYTVMISASLSGAPIIAYSLELECLSAELCGVNTEVLCDLQLNQVTYVNGQTVTLNVFRLANNRTSAAALELKLWLELPGYGPVAMANVGADGSFSLPGLFDSDYGPASLFPVSAAFPRGSYALGCRMVNPVTGRVLSADINPFVIQ